ncbi:MAG TPA: GNAT family N-acetyltransferase [Solirubrobacteraceae bacterium]|nr:GNAT family N-acetyltransferase [Solirubrobacteraceae bacterium]
MAGRETHRLTIRAADESHAGEVARVVNAAYAIGEAGLWLEGNSRTTAAAVAESLDEMLVATEDGRVVGCARVQPIDATTADLGLISVEPEHWGGGVGRRLVRAAEERMRAAGVRTVQLEVLVPRDGVHREKVKLRAWYERLGYEVVRTAPFEEIAVHPASDLAVPCEFLVFQRSIG